MEIREILKNELKSIWDNDDFVIGVIVNAKTEKSFETILDFISKAKEQGDEITPESIVLLSVRLMNDRKGITWV